MRMMLRFSIPVEKGNQAIKDGSMAKTLQSLEQRLKPEAAYFYVEAGKRTGFFVFDASDPSQVLVYNELLFENLNADVDIKMVLNSDDLQKGMRTVTS